MNKNCSSCLDGPEGSEKTRHRLGVYALDHFVRDVPDIAAAEPFFRALGLRTRRQEGALTVQAGAVDHDWAVITQGPHARLRRLSFATYPPDVAALRQRAAGTAYEILSETPDSFVLSGPDGIEVEIVARDRQMFDAVEANKPPLVPAVAQHKSQVIMPEALRLSHIAIFTSDVPRALDFYTNVVGLALSDRSGDTLAFLHAPHGSDHHVLALVKSFGPGVHHYSLDLGSIDAIGLTADNAHAQGYTAGWGFGRHVLGSNFFHYIRDPWGSHAELTAGLEYIAANEEWIAGDHPADDAFYLWGPAPPADFIENHQTP
jgi:catechol 2,3-dioxygenase